MEKELLIKILNEILESKTVFSNEQEFRFFLATKLQNKTSSVKFDVISFPNDWSKVKSQVNTEHKIKRSTKEYTDLVVTFKNGTTVAIELKYKLTDKAYIYGEAGKEILTMSQGAYDIGAYSFIKDICRLKQLISRKRYFVNDLKIDKTFCIFLTNDIRYRNNDLSGGKGIWKAFSLAEKTGSIKNNLRSLNLPFNIKSKNYKSYPDIDLSIFNKEIPIKWNDKIVEQLNAPSFHYLVVEITAES